MDCRTKAGIFCHDVECLFYVVRFIRNVQVRVNNVKTETVYNFHVRVVGGSRISVCTTQVKTAALTEVSALVFCLKYTSIAWN